MARVTRCRVVSNPVLSPPTSRLKAKFSTDPMLRSSAATVDNFQGNAVDPTLDRHDLIGRLSFTTTGAVAAGRHNDGLWSGTAHGRRTRYGAADERPTGIFGGFNAHFTDGHAAGAYATRK